MSRLTNKKFTLAFRPITTVLTPVVLAMQVSIIIQSNDLQSYGPHHATMGLLYSYVSYRLTILQFNHETTHGIALLQIIELPYCKSLNL